MENGVLADRVALITGSSRGIGRAVAERLAKAGADIVLNHRQDKPRSIRQVEEVAGAIRSLGRRVSIIRADISVREDVKEMFQQVRQEMGRLDFLILNAARAPFKPIEKLFEREVRQLVDTNYTGNIFCIQEAVPLLAETGGQVIFISSLGSRFYNPVYPLGSMKAAMEAVIRDISEELRPKGINANAVCGGIVKTDSFKVLRQYWENLELVPEEFLLSPEEIADAVYLLCLPEANAIRGQTLVVDKGISNRINRGIT